MQSCKWLLWLAWEWRMHRGETQKDHGKNPRKGVSLGGGWLGVKAKWSFLVCQTIVKMIVTERKMVISSMSMGLGVELVGQWPGSKVVEVAQKHFLSVGSSLPTRIAGAWKEKWMKNIGIGKFPMVLLFMHLVQRNGEKENCRICSFSVSLKEKP